MPSNITRLLIQRLEERDAVGLAKYGVSLDRKDLTVEEWLDHKTEELLDAAGYAQSCKREVAELRRQNQTLRTALKDLLEWIPEGAVMQFDDGDLPVSVFIERALS